ncbi:MULTISPECIES: transporter substrate-binding domain-containing protein [Pseudoalteromonas]|uniref:Transporter substrate-binding domain-containing protein n=1 Tax=Pseudoalteromonas lipolytica TaxID=570156 RepID=A0ABU8SNR2_9GAMM|nr:MULTISPECIES: transporter substrate-binding domain-containing protein [unclassified Pseudoalteromonas]MBC7007566.1 transporter substrate-binding domain-containing protein [Pseudoalteromonas sp. BZK2]MED5512271.1 transporter substrate-binding domain-containing protein [Pseudomonadota bacterium]NHH89417.1 hypothetical protein [Pseudoalteromonas sp. MB47]
MLKIVFPCLLFLFSTCLFANVKTINAKKNRVTPPTTLHVVYPKTMDSLDEEVLYPLILLRTALKRSGYKFTLSPAPELLSQNRVLKEIETTGSINVTWSMTNQEREDTLLPLRVPIFKGLFGWRLMFTTEDKLPRLKQLKSLDDLKSINLVQGTDWPDTRILTSNGLTVATAMDFESLFVMLDRGRGDLFPRSVLEIQDELAYFKEGMPLVVLPHLMLKYKSPIYFFFNKHNTNIAKAVSQGIKVMQQSGEFDELFFKYNGNFIKNAHLHDKIVIELHNYDLPRLTPVNDKSLWLAFDQVP